MSQELTLVNTRIDRAINELIDLDLTIAKASGNVSCGFAELKAMKQRLANNARIALGVKS